MLKRFLLMSLLAVGTFGISGCGGRIRLASPTQGQLITLAGNGGYAAPQQLIVQIDNPNAYADVSIQIIGQERLPAGMLSCSGGGAAPIYCNIQMPMNGMVQQGMTYAFGVQLTQGDWQDTRLVYIQVGQPMQR